MTSNRFVKKTFISAVSFFKDAVYSEEYSRRSGLLQRIDPSVKLITFLLLIIATAVVKSVALLVLIYFMSILLAIVSGVNMFYFIKRVWIFIPLFAALIAIPAIFSIFTPGDVVFTLKIFSLKLSVTAQGLRGSLLFVLRAATSVSLAVLLTLVTSHNLLLKALRSLKIPDIFLVTVAMTYRFLFLFMKNIEEMFMAVESRLIKKIGGNAGRKIMAQRAGMLWEKSRKMSEEVYLAMVARGYAGEVKVYDR